MFFFRGKKEKYTIYKQKYFYLLLLLLFFPWSSLISSLCIIYYHYLFIFHQLTEKFLTIMKPQCILSLLFSTLFLSKAHIVNNINTIEGVAGEEVKQQTQTKCM